MQSMSGDRSPLGDVRDAHALTNCVHELRWEVGTAAPASLGSLDIVFSTTATSGPESDFAYSPTFEFQQQLRLRCPAKTYEGGYILSTLTQLKHTSSGNREIKQEIKVQESATSKKETRMKKAQGEHGNNNHRAVEDICQDYIDHLMQSRKSGAGKHTEIQLSVDDSTSPTV